LTVPRSLPEIEHNQVRCRRAMRIGSLAESLHSRSKEAMEPASARDTLPCGHGRTHQPSAGCGQSIPVWSWQLGTLVRGLQRRQDVFFFMWNQTRSEHHPDSSGTSTITYIQDIQEKPSLPKSAHKRTHMQTLRLVPFGGQVPNNILHFRLHVAGLLGTV